MSPDQSFVNKDVIMELKDVSKKFPGTLALKNVNFKVYKSQIHAIVGENGAGKSTLIKILSGVYQPTEGKLIYKNSPIRFSSPKEAIQKGIITIYQEFSLAPSLSVEENIFLGNYPKTRFGSIDRNVLRENTKRLLENLNIDINPASPVSNLSVAEKQMVEIAKALSRKAEVLILDEPTAVLDKENAEKLFELLMNLRKNGIGLVYISHRLEEVFRLADEVTVLRDGEITGRSLVSEIDENWLIKKMIGREELIYKTEQRKDLGEKALEVINFSYNNDFNDVSFSVKKGEIVTLAGLVGAGRTEIAKSIVGIRPIDEGEIRIYGKKVKISSPKQGLKEGIMYLPEDRKEEGLFMNRSVKENISISNLEEFFAFLMINDGKEIRKTHNLVSTLKIKTPDIETPVKNLSGGNQQKVMLARLLGRECSILILDEPTRGVDIGAKEDIYKLIDELSKNGLAILLISSEMKEVVKLSDRVIVLRKGRIVKELQKEQISEENIIRAAIN